MTQKDYSMSITYAEGYINFTMNVPSSSMLTKLIYGALNDEGISKEQRRTIANSFILAGQAALEDLEVTENPISLSYNLNKSNLT